MFVFVFTTVRGAYIQQVAAIGIFDSFDVDKFEPEEPDPELFRRRSTSTGGEVLQKS